VAMGSPLAPVLANLFMSFNEKKWLDYFTGNKPILYRRYVDDIFCVFDCESDALSFLDYLNKQPRNIKFTSESQKDLCLPFLDVYVSPSEEGIFSTSIYRKPTFTGLLTNFTSFIPLSYKFALVKTLVSRIYEISSS